MYRPAVLTLVVVLSLATLAKAADQSANPTANPLQKAVATLQDHFNRGDAKALAACWTTDGDFIGSTGERLVGRQSIEKAFEKFLAEHKGSKIALHVTDHRLLSDAVALVDLVAEMQPARENREGDPLSTIVYVKPGDQWLIASFRETIANATPQPSHLKDLAWMVGDWTDATANDSGVHIRSSCAWAGNGRYLIRKFGIAHQGQTARGGTEVIGWDPRAHRIRSWTFNADGAFGESTWTRDGNQWLVKYHGILADGSDVSATHLVTLTDADTLTLESKERRLDGQRQADVAPVTIKRVPAAEAQKTPQQPLPRKKLLPQ